MLILIMLVEEFNMGPNITLTAFDGLVMFGPFIAMTILMAIGFAFNNGAE